MRSPHRRERLSPVVGEPYVGAYVYVRNNPVRWVDPSGQVSRPADQPLAATNPGGCLTTIYGATAATFVNLGIAAGGLVAGGVSITLWGISFGISTPVTASGLLAAAGLEGIAAASEVFWVGLTLQACFNTVGGNR